MSCCTVGMVVGLPVSLDLAPAFLLRFRPAREWNSGLALRSPLKRTEYLKPSCSPFSGLRTVRP